MSEQRNSQRSSSDFSIARILSNDFSPNPKKKFKDSDKFDFKEEKFNYHKVVVKKQMKIQTKDDKLKEMERLNLGSVMGDKIDLKEDGNERSRILGKELPWLRCTRYSPPKLPRRPSSGKQARRRLGSHPRIPFTKLQIQVLEGKFRISAYLSRRDVIQLAGSLNLPQNRVKIWFQNRRARERRELQSRDLAPNS